MNLLERFRPSLLDRYVIREIVPPTFVGLLLFTFILLLDQIANLLKILVSRGAEFATVVRALLYLLPSIFSITIPMAFLLGVLLAFGRLASESEIVAMRASGISPLRLLKPVGVVAGLACLITFYVVAVALPAANQAYREIIFALVISKAKTSVTARVFNDELIPGRNMILYVSDIPAETGEWRNVFLYDFREPQQPTVILARQGRLLVDKERKNIELDLREGTRYRFSPLSPERLEQQRFSSGLFPLPFADFFPTVPLAKGDREMSLGDLQQRVRELRKQGKGRLDTGRYEVEYHKKFAIPAACLVFGILGLGLSLGSKKEARSAAFGLSIAIIFVYYVLIRLGEQAGDTALMAPWLAMWAANIVLGIAAVVLIVLNHREAAFDPLDPSHYTALLPRIRRRGVPEAAAESVGVPGPEPHRAGAARPARAGAPPRAAGPRKVVVLRIPRMALPIPGILDRYIARAYVGKFALVLTTFWVLFVLVSFTDLLDDMQQNKVKGVVLLHYFAFKSGDILHLMTPVAVLVSVLITFGIMARRQEITAMKAAGISVYRAVLPALGLGLAISVGMFAASEYLIPPLNRVAAEDFNRIKGRPPQSTANLQNRWMLGSDGKFYNYDYLERDAATGRATFYGLSVFDVGEQAWELNSRLFAGRAVWNGVSYSLERDSWRRSFRPLKFARVPEGTRTREIDPPHYFSQEQRESETLSFAELRGQIRALEGLGLDVTRLRVELHRKVAFPMVSLVMTLLGIPFAFVVSRRGALYGVAASMVLAIVYWAFLAIFEALGNYAVLPPALAAWAPNLLFGAAGLFFTLTLET